MGNAGTETARWDATVGALAGLVAGAGLTSNEKRIEDIYFELNRQYLGTKIRPQHEAGCDNYPDTGGTPR